MKASTVLSGRARRRSRSLRGRLLLGFIVCTSLLWFTLVGWGIYSMLEHGKLEAADDLNDYARQVLFVVSEFSDQPDELRRALQGVVMVENEDIEDEDERFAIQIWLRGQPIVRSETLPNSLPASAGYDEFEFMGRLWMSSTAIEESKEAAVRTVALSGVTANLDNEQLFFLFLPLVISLPLLLIPAWIMTRFGLKPLAKVVDQIDERVDSNALDPIDETPYRELNTIVHAINSLMMRLSDQLVRERAFVTDVAHELKTPMAILQTNIDILADSGDDKKRRQASRDLRSGVLRSNHLINQLLRMARMDQGATKSMSMRELDVAEFVRERAAQAASLADRRGIQLEADTPPCLRLQIDVDAIAAVIDNLIDNAIKYSPRESTAWLSLCYDDAASEFSVVVEDQGSGIRNEDHERVFDRFTRLANASQFEGGTEDVDADLSGAGLGLSIVAKAVQRLGGRIALSTPATGVGLRVGVTLPFHPPAIGVDVIGVDVEEESPIA